MATAGTHPINSSDWPKVYPVPRDRSLSPLKSITPSELADLMRNPKQKAGKDFLVVDVRRADCEVFTFILTLHQICHSSSQFLKTVIPGAVNLPAHSFHATLPTLLALLAPIPLVIFHCNRSQGRGPRAAGWYADALEDLLRSRPLAGEEGPADEVARRVAVLQGGIQAWEHEFGRREIETRGQGARDLTDLQSVQL